MMWVLVFIILTPVAGIDKTILLETYPSLEVCESEKGRIMVEMNKAYPGDPTWTLACLLTPKGV